MADRNSFVKVDPGSLPSAGEWTRRYKAHAARLRSGDPPQIAEVVRLLTDHRARHGLSQAEQRMLDRAETMLEED